MNQITQLLLFVFIVSIISFYKAQVGINTSFPKSTLDMTSKTTDCSKPEGLIAPRLSGD